MRHLLKLLAKNPSMPLLVIFQVAIACGIACNVMFVLHENLAPLMLSEGVNDPSSLLVAHRLLPKGVPWTATRMQEFERQVRGLPDVKAVSYAISLPVVGNVKIAADVLGDGMHTKSNAAIYLGDNLVNVLGLTLLKGRDFSSEEKNTILGQGMGLNTSGPVIITNALAKRLFPGDDALGGRIHFSGGWTGHKIVVGIVKHLMANDTGPSNISNLDNSILIPGVLSKWSGAMFAIRTQSKSDKASLKNNVLNIINRDLGHDLLQGFTPGLSSYENLRDVKMSSTKAEAWLFATVSAVVFLITLIGVAGMTSYWVRQRTKRIGIYRALGATRLDILRDFQIENLLIVGAGIFLGLFAGYGINYWLMRHYEFHRLPWQYLILVAVIFTTLGQVAAFIPALRASRIPPIVATRSI